MRALVLAVLGLATAGAAGDDAQRWKQPVRGTFAHTRAPLGDVVADLRATYQQEIALKADPKRLVDLELERATLFEALDALASGNGLVLRAKRDRSVVLEKHVPGMPRPEARYLGPSRLAVKNALRTKTYEGEDVLRLSFDWWAPKGLLCGLVDVRLDKCVDDEGRRHRLRAEDRYRGFPVGPFDGFDLMLDPPRPSARALATLSGECLVALPVERKSVTFRVGPKARSKRLGRSTITLHPVDGDAPMLRFVVDGWTCRRFRGGEVGSPRIRFLSKGATNWGVPPRRLAAISVFCHGANGTEVGQSGRITSGQTSGEPRWEYGYGIERVPERVVFTAVTKVEVRSLKFTFANVPLR